MLNTTKTVFIFLFVWFGFKQTYSARRVKEINDVPSSLKSLRKQIRYNDNIDKIEDFKNFYEDLSTQDDNESLVELACRFDVISYAREFLSTQPKAKNRTVLYYCITKGAEEIGDTTFSEALAIIKQSLLAQVVEENLQ